MSNVCRLALARKSERAQLICNWLAAAELTLYGGTAPIKPEDELTGNSALATFLLPDPAGTVEDGVLTLAAGTEPATVLTTGRAVFGRLIDSAEAVIGDFDVGLLGSESVLILDNVNLIEGSLVSILSFTMSEG